MDTENNGSLFETKKAKGRVVYRLFASTVFIGICLIWIYRVIHLPAAYGLYGRWIWIGLFVSELWFGFYWILTQSVRWNLVFRSTFKDRLSQRFEQELPEVDIYVCTADPKIEPPMLVINTVLSVMAYDYPSEKVSVYLSDDGGSDLTFYALLEASFFAKHWVPYCKKFKVEPRSPAAYFSSLSDFHPLDGDAEGFGLIRNLYEEMESRIENAAKLGRISDEIRRQHPGFAQWSSSSSKRDHDTILQILIGGRDKKVKDTEGCILPSLVYLAREKRPQHSHNFKAGAMNALIRVSSEISNGDIILNVDCDMYSNNSESVRDALCFFMDEEKGHEVAFVQFPQSFSNTTKNDVYGNSMLVISEIDFHGLDGNGGPLYIGTGCFHRRESLCGKKYFKGHKNHWNKNLLTRKSDKNVEIEERVKGLASCTYEENTLWGIEMGLKYGCPVEDVITGLAIQCNGWKSIYFNPKRKAFLGVAPTSLGDLLVQHKRWSEGDFQIFLSKYSPVWYGLGKISTGLQMGYCIFCVWAPNCFATLYYSVFPSISLLHGLALFPQVSSPWFLPFAYVIIAIYGYSLAEFLWSGGTVLGWWNEQRIWLYKRTASYLFGCTDTILKQFGFSETSFIITAKVTDEEVSTRYEQEMMEFGTSSPMFTILATLALLNTLCFDAVITKKVVARDSGTTLHTFNEMGLQIFLCGVLFLVNLPLLEALFVRKDNGRMPASIAVKSAVIALFACTCFAFL